MAADATPGANLPISFEKSSSPCPEAAYGNGHDGPSQPLTENELAGRQGFEHAPVEHSEAGLALETCPQSQRPNGRWLGGRDSNPDNVVQSHVSYR
jgi:hypothetical protein